MTQSRMISFRPGKRILMIDQSAGDQRLILELLGESAGDEFQLSTADTLAQGINKLDQNSYDAIFLDLSLPENKGLQSVQQMIEAAPRTPIIVLSSIPSDQLALNALHAGAQDFLVKGQIAPNELTRTLRHAMERMSLQNRIRVFQQAIQSTTNGIAILNIDTDQPLSQSPACTIAHVNKAFAEMLNADSNELIGRQFFTLVNEEEGTDRIAHAIRERRAERAILQMSTLDNKTVWCRALVTPVYEADGLLHHYICVCEDVTDQLRVEQRLLSIVQGTSPATGRAFFHKLTRNIAEALEVKIAFVVECDTDDSGRALLVCAWNGEAYEENITYDLAGTPCELVNDNEPCIIKTGVQERYPDDQWMINHNADSYYAIPLLDAAGKRIGHMGVIDTAPLPDDPDIESIVRTFAARASAEIQRGLSEDSMFEENTFINEIFQTVRSLIVVLDGTGSIILFNQACQLLTGLEPAQVYGKNIVEALIAENQKSHVHRFMTQLVNGHEHASDQHDWIGADNKLHTILWNYAVLRKDNGNIRCIIGAGVDITEQIHAEQQKQALKIELKQAQKLKAVGSLASGVAHDFNNLLTVVASASQTVRNKISLHQPVGSSLDQIDSAVDHASNITRSLLAFAQTGSTNKSVFDLASLTRQTLKFLQGVLPAAIKINININNISPVWITGDQAQFKQIYTNLAINAKDAMPQGGTLTVTLNTSSPSKLATIILSDTGDGIDPSITSRIFEPFFSTHTREQGTGLGLSIVHGIITDHQGTISVHSSKSQGTTFTIQIPLTDPSQIPTNPAPNSKQTRIITLIDPDLYVSSITASALRAAGHTVKTSTKLDPQNLLEPTPDLIIIHQRSLNPSCTTPNNDCPVPTLLLADSNQKNSTLKENFSSVLHEPFNMNDLLHAVNLICTHPTSTPQSIQAVN